MQNNLNKENVSSLAKKALMLIGAILFFVFGGLALLGEATTYIIIFAILAILGLALFLLPIIKLALNDNNKN